MLKKIFETIMINQTSFKNRLVVSAMVSKMCQADGMPSEVYMAYHERKAKGGWGLIITEDYRITPDTGTSLLIPGLWEDEQIAPNQIFTDRIHAAGGKVACQLFHAGRENSFDLYHTQPVAPTAIKDPTQPDIPRELTIDEIHEIVEQFGDAALRAKKAGFDAIELHGAHGYLIEQFVSPFSNKRGDEYGGSIYNRTRFAAEIVKNVREKCGAEFPIIYRMSVREYMEGGLDIEESKAVAMILEQAGVDCFHCSQGVYASTMAIISPSAVAKGAYIDHAYEIKKVVSVPVIGVGRVNDPILAESILLSGKADMCTMARASLADPDLPNKAAAGKFDEILYCLGCMQGCIGETSQNHHLHCLVNPLTGRETEYQMKPAEVSKRVVVVGGGIAGCEAAIVAAKRGHQVTLLEKTEKLGGQWNLASIPPTKGDFSSLLAWQKRMLQKHRVTVKMGVLADREMIDALDPDVVINAAGSTPTFPPIPGLREHTVTAWDALDGKVSAGKHIAVLGGGLVGAETADHFAVHGHQVSVIDMLPDIMMDGEPKPKKMMLERYEKHQVAVYTSAKIQKIEADRVVCEKDGQVIVIDGLDTIINATGRKADQMLKDALAGASYQVLEVGDVKDAKSGYLNLLEGFDVAMKL